MKKTRVVKIALAILICGASITLLGCFAKSTATPTAQNQMATVQRSNLTLNITAVGNLALSQKQDVTFETAGTVDSILVEEGQPVEEEQVLVTLNQSDWQDQLTALEKLLTTAQRQLTTKQRDELQAEIGLNNAEISLEKTKDAWLDTVAGGKAVKQARDYFNYVVEKLGDATTPEAQEDWVKELDDARKDLLKAESNLGDTESASKDIALSGLQLQLAQGRLEDAKTAVEDAMTAIADAQKAVDDFNNTSPEIKAPITGFITSISVVVGDEVKKGALALQIADPTKFEAGILVSEQDIFNVKIGSDASVSVDALSALTLPAKVTYMSPTATVSQGVVNYRVTVELQSLQPVLAGQSGQGRTWQGQQPQSETDGQDTSASGNQSIQRPSGQFQRPQSGAVGQSTSTPEQAVQLKDGLSVTVNILTMQKDDVLLVPNQAISRQGGKSVVNVLSNGVAEQRTITTGISNWQYTEVTDGLTEGEQVVIPQATVSASNQQQGGIFRSGGLMR